MTGEEFKRYSDGLTAVKIARLTGRTVVRIYGYSSGKVRIPFEVAGLVMKIYEFLEKNKLKKDKTMSSIELKKVIGGKMYNTMTAECLGHYDNGLGDNDFNSLTEELYRTASGKFFIAGEGGAPTGYAHCEGNSRWGGSGIVPVDADTAKEWMEAHGTADEYIAAFGEPPEA